MLKAIATGMLWAGVALGSTAWAADADFKLINRTGFDIEKIYISPTNRNQWGRDRLGEWKLLNNQSKVFRFGDTKNCRQDIRVEFSDGDELEWDNLNLCTLSQITLRYNRKTREVSVDAK
jgi:hypothetical protein